ncbi:MAG: hypothetical protein DM484_24015 [Candidatus Methylumidiphilus alinenensis]|uniref:Uncharacterized protein n=1 Tax=Candidatus Methylumidiphilus alinenensis TaxID=2202197 RepID=A0A2W4QKP7_9GAMM|nr:MAG: hypothetical protein DM484_24015 [Candidatus Methylumidiphilus alinenensis]
MISVMAKTSPKLPVLLYPDDQDSAGQTLSLTSGALDLRLSLAADQELAAECSLRLNPAIASDQTGVVQLDTLNAQTSCDLGVFPTAKPITWLLADWGTERPLASIEIKTTTPGKARIKVFRQGAWMPLHPVELIVTGTVQAINPLVAEKLLIELVQAGQYPGLWNPVTATITGLALQAATLPGDLSLTVGGQTPGFRAPGLLSVAGVPVEGFAAAVNAYLAGPKALRPVPLRLSAGLPGRLNLAFNPAAVTVVRQLTASADGVLPLVWEGLAGAAKASLTIPSGALLRELSFAVEVKLLSESLQYPFAASATGRAQLARAMDGVAVWFSTDPQGPPLIGLDLKLSPRSGELQATLGLHADCHGYPEPTPYAGAVLPIHWLSGVDAGDAEDWLRLDLPRSFHCPSENVWAVLTVHQGEALWELGSPLRYAQRTLPSSNLPGSPDIPLQEEVGACLYHKGEGAWLNRGGNDRPQIRLRVAAAEPAAPDTVTVQRGRVQVTLPISPEGRVRADAATLDALNGNKSSSLEIRFQAASAGQITLRELRTVF